MFDFLDSDWFNITLEVIFIILISYDIKKYIETKKREYIVNIVLTLVFAVWTLYPYYNSYVGWDEKQKAEMISTCTKKEVSLEHQKENNETLCKCVDEAIFKEYTYDEYKAVDKNGTDFKEFIKETKEECADDSWF
ncbi:MAG: hypothetical protein A3E21_06800 [Sulfurimonas sp. RIFCSPHIGHO2_12_FULL_36_9]|uniref:hypothetical protein n=1 Tax=Sulfurimonas sp. RIFCSPLOWO2_12_36_12 TaxID=1802253 RepID=UPI0008B554D7|nr:hypothetical protein [Sulfurimonas sp. RIFCSPLOWO2_12_36_12]OHD97068.1 MAG: hypothetical protein A3E21_06800 [Sulfurimonas sp. RIFCSPHIGHO2_12_FULL_36_9]OHE00441.1 MAG: hypothetical protein A2W82_03945 [Sulfurimonas sp. RIFCSPLOWO2_12_36_12]OHE07451.1 MAG: hypothetical protein A3K14_02505 [Sulfurimonas sp. RIFCSPLOWO2_12_FULL_36_74]